MNTNLIRCHYGRAAISVLLIAFGTAQALANQGAPPLSQAQVVAPLATIPQYVLPPTDVQAELAVHTAASVVYFTV